MARYIGPKCKLSRRENYDLELKSGIRPLWEAETGKCRRRLPGADSIKRLLGRLSDFGLQLRAKQRLKRAYGVSERYLRNCFKKASRLRGSTGENILLLLERRLDNVVYRMGFASTRAEARQLVTHATIKVNGKVVTCPSYLVSPGDVIEVTEKGKAQLRIEAALKLAEQRKPCDWIEVDPKAKRGIFKRLPDRSELPAEYSENLVVEHYSSK